MPPPGTYPDALADHDMTPIYDFVADHYRLEYRTAQTWTLNSLGRGFTSRADYTAAFYSAYNQADPATLVVHSPTDMVASLLESPHRYLVDGAALPSTATRCRTDTAGESRAAALTHRQLALALRPLKERLDETATFIHKVHSFAQIMDPKVERLTQDLSAEARQQLELRASVQGLAKRMLVLTGLVLILILIELANLIVRI